MRKLFTKQAVCKLCVAVIAATLLVTLPATASASEGHSVASPGLNGKISVGADSYADGGGARPVFTYVWDKYGDDHDGRRDHDHGHTRDRGHNGWHDRDRDYRGYDRYDNYYDGYSDGYDVGYDDGYDARGAIVRDDAAYSDSENPYVGLTAGGPAWAEPGETIRYTFSEIKNKTGYALPGFYWRETIAADAVRLTTVNTGVWSGTGTYSFWIVTNQEGWRKVYSALERKTAYGIDMTSQAMGLAAGEYVTEFMLDFGTVEAGFHATQAPSVSTRVLSNLASGYSFTNYSDVGTRDGDFWDYDRESVTTVCRQDNPYRGGYYANRWR